MDSALRPVPSIFSLYRQDAILGKALWMAFFGLVVAGGTRWASNGITPGPGTSASELEAFQIWIPIGGIVVSACAAMAAAWRYSWIKKVLTHGTLVRAMVADLERRDFTTTGSDSQGRDITTHTYYVTLRYEMQGRERKVRMRLPNSGFTYGLVKGQETEVRVSDASPDKPLICSMYLRK